ncbi:hypothetical protein [Campylobacter pinnipediorum]|nr:hypothetical protein [Campylobacter pinnipediorum]
MSLDDFRKSLVKYDAFSFMIKMQMDWISKNRRKKSGVGVKFRATR